MAVETINATIECLEGFAIKLLRKMFALRQSGQLPQSIQQADYAIVRMFTQLFEVFATDYYGLVVNKNEDTNIMKILEMIVVYCTIWAFGGSLNSEGRKNFDIALRELDGSIPSSDTVFDYRVDMVKK